MSAFGCTCSHEHINHGLGPCIRPGCHCEHGWHDPAPPSAPVAGPSTAAELVHAIWLKTRRYSPAAWVEAIALVEEWLQRHREASPSSLRKAWKLAELKHDLACAQLDTAEAKSARLRTLAEELVEVAKRLAQPGRRCLFCDRMSYHTLECRIEAVLQRAKDQGIGA